MAIEHIIIDSSKTLSSELKQSVDIGWAFYQKILKLKRLADRMNDGTDYSAVEESFGVPVGTGSGLTTLLGAVLTNMESVGVKNFLERLG